MGNGKKIELRILFVTQNDPMYVKEFFAEFFRLYGELDEIAGVVITKPMNRKSELALARMMFGFYGAVDFTRVGLKYARNKLLGIMPSFVTMGRDYNIEQLCNRHGIRCIYENDVNSRRFQEEMEAMRVDLIVSVASSVIFREGLINLPQYGCINLHNGRLPYYRGMMPTFWQMFNDEESIGLTIHEINSEIDGGRIMLQRDVDIHAGETLDSVMRRSKKIGARFMVEAIRMVKAGKVEYRANCASEGSYFSFPTKEEANEFRRRGKRMI